GGELRGVIDGRDQIVGGFIDQLDELAAALIFEFNRLHASGEGTAGFTSLSSEARLSDPAAALNAAGLAFTPTHGSFQLKVANAASGITQTTAVSIDLDGIGADTSLEDLRAALDAIDGVSAVITTQGRLQITADAGFEFRFADDTSGVLAALGLNTFFTGTDSGSIGVNAALAANPGLLASSRGGGPADNRNAVELARILDLPLATLGGASLDEFYNTAVSSLAQGSAAETAVAQGLDSFRTSLQNQRDQFSGVSLDEEAIRMLQFQQAFQSAARLIGVVDELFRTLLAI
ncbi:MAG TPA: flagellar basal body rod C-terminal domain-containing protein, partial [Planctomycetaceae bacterium]|nr:flagellar basal body rod C-terminal domain-containing protein [Planctomycetaceae bacterium]